MTHALEAAARVLDLRARTAVLDTTLVEAATWVLTEAGLPSPVPAEPEDAPCARLMVAAQRRDAQTVEALLDGWRPSPANADFLSRACAWVRAWWGEGILAVVACHPGRDWDGAVLARHVAPDRLLAALPPGRILPDANARATVAELVIVGRDRGVRDARPEALWAGALAEAPRDWRSLRDIRLRIAARGPLDEAVELLRWLADQGGREVLQDGPTAIITRLNQVDPERAVALVRESRSPMDRALWLTGLCWGGSLSPAAGALIDELLTTSDAEVRRPAITALALTTDVERLRRALTAATFRPDWLAATVGVGMRRHSRAGRDQVAAAQREAVLPKLDRNAADRLDVYAGYRGPSRSPWGEEGP